MLTSAHAEDTNPPPKPPWGSQECYRESRLHPNPKLSVAKLPRGEAPVLASPGCHGRQGGDQHWLDVVGAEPSCPHSPQAGVRPGLVGCSARASGLGQTSLLPFPQSPPSCSLGVLWLPPKYGSKSTLGTATQSRTPPSLLVNSEAVKRAAISMVHPSNLRDDVLLKIIN